MSNDPLIEQIEGIGYRRLIRSVRRFVLILLGVGLVVGIVAKHTQDQLARGAIALAASGFVIGYATSVLTAGSRRFLKLVFVLFPFAAALVMFVFRTLLGRYHELPLRLVVAPLCFSAGFLAGQLRIRSTR